MQHGGDAGVADGQHRSRDRLGRRAGQRADAGGPGPISKVTPDTLTIATQDGTEKTLTLVPQTSVTIDGQDSDTTALVEGLPVRASFNTVEDREVAVQVVGVRTPETTGPSIDPGGGTGGAQGSQSSGQSQGNYPENTNKGQLPQPR